MERLTLREAAQRTARSITTLRRYIRSGRLRAEKRFGRFGPEYYLDPADLVEAGFELDAQAQAGQQSHTPVPLSTQARPAAADAAATAGSEALTPARSIPPAMVPSGEQVPMTLFQELQMKHEQLLVQYGMIRAAGMRNVDLQQKLERSEQRIESMKLQLERSDRAQSMHSDTQEQELRQAQLELKGRALEIAALKEKVRALEMLTRNAVTNETIENQFTHVLDQTRRVERLGAAAPRPVPASDAQARSWNLGPLRKNPSTPDNDA